MEWRTFNVNATRDGAWLKVPGPHPRPEVGRAGAEPWDGEAAPEATGAQPLGVAASAAVSPSVGQSAGAEAPASAEAGDAKRRKVEAAPTVEDTSPLTFQQGAALQVDIPVLMNIRQVNAGQELRYYQAPKPAKVDGKPKTKAKQLKIDLSRIWEQAAV